MNDLLLTADSFELIKNKAIQNLTTEFRGHPQLNRIIQAVSEIYDLMWRFCVNS
jgi:hypothetical protein